VCKPAYYAESDAFIDCLQRNATSLLVSGHVMRSTGLRDTIEGEIGCA
jgi:hypothetical protein